MFSLTEPEIVINNLDSDSSDTSDSINSDIEHGIQGDVRPNETPSCGKTRAECDSDSDGEVWKFDIIL